MVSRRQGPFKTQKPCARWRDADCDEVADSAPGDPAMVLMLRMASILPMVQASCPLRPAAGLLLDVIAHDHFRKPQQRFYGSCKNARNGRARAELAVSPVRLNTRLGMSSPLPISARARSRPATVT